MDFFATFLDCLLDTVIDTLKLLPILFLTYLLMEAVEHKAGEKTLAFIRSARGWGPLAGGALGIIPQCGIAGGAANLYATNVITVGTFLAVMLATSDEMLPILLSDGSFSDILRFLLFKLVYGIAAGFAVDGAARARRALLRRRGIAPRGDENEISSVCEREGCDCDEHGIFRSALHHTLHVTVLLFVVSLVISCLVTFIGKERIAALPIHAPVLGELIAGLIGLIPNCSISVMLTEFYLEGVIDAGQMMAGLLVNGGVGLLVLYRTNKGRPYLGQNLAVTGILLFLGVAGGLIASVIL